ncbi:hypothetical protein [Amaricoccus sp.]|uniref:hypothetical protein n=1 Tax=Amaricoccus sp. TaxID=1872485 RepID=UPI001B49BDD1|nr:hypothetical protein [Amaricoccus sp.]MBP7001354.1 hypothetical protein [Amaricoccus sp.]
MQRAQSSRDISGRFTSSELDRARRVEVVVLPLGPYRNLTTMTAALYALHPNGLVLNHAAQRVLGSPVDPFADLGDERWLRFKAAAFRLAQHGRGGNFGGNVLLSHAFANSELAKAYAARFGEAIVKPDTKALFWKDSTRLQNRIMEREGLIDELLERQPGARFLFPVRNPMDCARSNMRTGHWRYLVAEGAGFDAVLRKILELLQWFRRQERARPDRFLSFTETEIDAGFPERIAAFSNLPAPASWAVDDAPKAIEVVQRSAHAPEVVARYAELVADLFGDDPEMRRRLEQFAQ